MSDRDTLRLERALAADPSDAVALEALSRALTRSGRGWAGETLPRDLVCSPKERGVYVWTRHGLGLEVVWVPEARRPEIPLVSEISRLAPMVGVRPPISPPPAPAFWIGRYPVTRGEFLAFVWPEPRKGQPWKGTFDHPVVNVTHADALAFAAWAGLRLPTSAEWTRAALGDGRVSCSDCSGKGGHESWDPWDGFSWSACEPCHGIGHAPRLYPWGNEAPTPERCVAASFAGRFAGPGWPPASLPVRDANDKPARPEGASPCGAMDMVMHVWQWVAPAPWGGLVRRGTSFRDYGESVSRRFRTPRAEASDDAGFRVALSESTA